MSGCENLDRYFLFVRIYDLEMKGSQKKSFFIVVSLDGFAAAIR